MPPNNLPALDLDGAGAGEAGLAEVDFDAELGEAFDGVVMADDGADAAEVFHDAGEVDLRLEGADPPGAGEPDVMDGAGGADEGLRGNASGVEAVAAEEMTLDQGHLRPDPGGAGGADEARRPRPDDDEVVGSGRGGVLVAGRVDLFAEVQVVPVRWGDRRNRAHGRPRRVSRRMVRGVGGARIGQSRAWGPSAAVHPPDADPARAVPGPAPREDSVTAA